MNCNDRPSCTLRLRMLVAGRIALSVLLTLLFSASCQRSSGPDDGVVQRQLQGAAQGLSVVASDDAKADAPAILKSDIKPIPSRLADLLSRPAGQRELYDAARAEKVGLIVLKRQDSRRQESTLRADLRMGLALDLDYFDPLWRDDKVTVLAPTPEVFARNPGEWTEVFDYLRGQRPELPAGLDAKLPFITRARLVFADVDVASDTADNLADILRGLRAKIAGASFVSRVAQEPVVLALDRRPGVLMMGTSARLEAAYVMGDDCLSWKNAAGDIFRIDALDAMRLSINGINDLAEQFITMSNGAPQSAAERRQRKRLRMTPQTKAKVEEIDTDPFFASLAAGYPAWRMTALSQDAPGAEPRYLRRGRVPSVGLTNQDLSLDALRAAFIRSADFLRQHFDEKSGMFGYEYYPQDSMKRGGRYNLIRHNLATFTLLEAYELSGDEAYLAAARKAIEFIGALVKKDDSRGICWFNHEKFDRQVKLGGAGTYLFAMIEYTRFRAVPQWDPLIRCQAELIRTMQKPSGEYESFFYPDGKANPKDQPVYIYPGEADLALMLLYERGGDKRYLETVKKSFAFYRKWFDDHRSSKGLLGPYVPWAMSAFAELYRISGDPAHLAYVKDMGQWLLEDIRTAPEGVWSLYQFGSYSFGLLPQSYPLWNTGVYAEGLASLALLDPQFLPPLAATFAFILNLQLSPWDTHLMKRPGQAVGCIGEHQFNYECRLDYIYHPFAAVYRILRHGGAVAPGVTEAVTPKVPAQKPFIAPTFPMPLPDSLRYLAKP